eukprot:2522309-Ditylum_brightwellii.AAC.1
MKRLLKGTMLSWDANFFKFWCFSSCAARLDFPYLLTPCHVAALNLTTADVKHLKSGKQYLSKMRLVVDKITRLGVAAGVTTKPKNT